LKKILIILLVILIGCEQEVVNNDIVAENYIMPIIEHVSIYEVVNVSANTNTALMIKKDRYYVFESWKEQLNATNGKTAVFDVIARNIRQMSVHRVTLFQGEKLFYFALVTSGNSHPTFYVYKELEAYYLYFNENDKLYKSDALRPEFILSLQKFAITKNIVLVPSEIIIEGEIKIRLLSLEYDKESEGSYLSIGKDEHIFSSCYFSTDGIPTTVEKCIYGDVIVITKYPLAEIMLYIEHDEKAYSILDAVEVFGMEKVKDLVTLIPGTEVVVTLKE